MIFQKGYAVRTFFACLRKIFIWISWKGYALHTVFGGGVCRKSGGKWRKVFKRNFENATHFSANWILFRSWSWKIIGAYLFCFSLIISKNVFRKRLLSACSCCRVGKGIYMNFLKTLRTFRWIESPAMRQSSVDKAVCCGLVFLRSALSEKWRKVAKGI